MIEHAGNRLPRRVLPEDRGNIGSRLPRSVIRELTPSEAQFERWVISLARSLGYLAFHAHMSRHSEAGFPDLALLRERDGRLVLAELKVGDGVVRPMQQRWLDAAARNPRLEWYLWRYVWPGDVMQEIAEVLARD